MRIGLGSLLTRAFLIIGLPFMSGCPKGCVESMPQDEYQHWKHGPFMMQHHDDKFEQEDDKRALATLVSGDINISR